MNVHTTKRIGLLSLLLFVVACSDGGSAVIVNLRTDYVPNVEFEQVRIFLASAGAAGEDVLMHTVSNGDYVSGQRIASFEDIANGEYRVRAELLAQNGRLVGQRSLAFSLSQSTSATIVVTRNCSGVICPDGSDPGATECSGGRCVQPECSPETPAACGAEGCTESAECDGTASCADGVCTTEGSCIFMPIEGACESDEFCDSTVGCLPLPVRTDAGQSDASTPDAGPSDAGPGMDAGNDAGLPPSCDAPCDTGNPCEIGFFDCSTGVPVCSAMGAGNAGAVCREAAGECDLAETCDGVSAECPSDEKQSAGLVCNPATNDCDVAEQCDGTTNACPLDAFQPVGAPCAGGFCDEGHMCSDTCTPGASCTPSNICRTGQISCAGGVPSCVEMGNVTNGTECQATEFGAWGACGSFSGTCDETGSQDRSVDDFNCQSGACSRSSSSESRACMRGTEGGSCGSVVNGSWGVCGGFSGTCDETGLRSRTVTTPTCASSMCDPVMTVQNGGCSRSTDGLSCGGVTFGSWSACGGFSTVCDTTGTQSRSVMTPTCGSATCGVVTTSESRDCTRATNGNSCGSATAGAWGACGYVDCALGGTRTRTITQPVCSSGTCSGTTMSPESGPCTRSSSQGDSCGTPTYGSWGTCFHPAICDPAVDATETRTAIRPLCSAANTCTDSDNSPDVRVCPLVGSEGDDGGQFCECVGPFDCAL